MNHVIYTCKLLTILFLIGLMCALSLLYVVVTNQSTLSSIQLCLSFIPIFITLRGVTKMEHFTREKNTIRTIILTFSAIMLALVTVLSVIGLVTEVIEHSIFVVTVVICINLTVLTTLIDLIVKYRIRS
jgi:hypothetical protein